MTTFPKNARVAFIGDSLTHVNNYVSRIIAHYRMHLPELQVKFWNYGISGGTAATAAEHLEEDIAESRPTHAVILLGVNDSARGSLSNPPSEERDARIERAYTTYCERMEGLVHTLRARGIEVILCTPAPYAEWISSQETPLPGGHRLIWRYAEAVRALAKREGLPLVDYHARMDELMLDETDYSDDRVHPVELGYWRMAECFLRAQGQEIDPFRPVNEVRELAGLTVWADEVMRVQNIRATEYMLISKEQKTLEEKLDACRAYVEARGWGEFTYFEMLSRGYLEDKPQEAELRAHVSAVMESLYD